MTNVKTPPMSGPERTVNPATGQGEIGDDELAAVSGGHPWIKGDAVVVDAYLAKNPDLVFGFWVSLAGGAALDWFDD